ncbi:MAG TPA: transglutaminase family protein, partial [Steroidobacteraceae bacterium]|nr:transglutaminase family protein [Steroidobacteraceae bacterium]
LHLTPRSSARQRCLEHRIRIAPTPLVYSEHMDCFGNLVTRFELDRPHDRLQVVAEMEVELEAVPQPPCGEGHSWQQVRDALCYQAHARDAEWVEAQRFRGESPYVRVKRLFGDFARGLLDPSATVLEVADGLMSRLHEEFTYEPGATEIATPLLQVLEQRRGVCQDYAHLMIACLRSVGLAARYVSGYLYTRTSRTAAAGAPAVGAEAGTATRLVGADASHAWVAVFAPPFGWVEFDPTNDMRVAQEHIALAWGRDFGDVSPLRGVILGGGSHSLTVRVAVQPRAP